MKQIWESIVKVTIGNLFRYRSTISNSYNKTENYFNVSIYSIKNPKKDLNKIKLPSSKAKRLTSKF